MKKILLFFIVFFVLLVVGIKSYTWLNKIESKIFVGGNKTVAISGDSISDKLKNNLPFNILLMGYGGGTHDGAYLTDSLIVVHVDPQEKQILLISIPRDIWVKIPTDSSGQYFKINAAYEIGLDDTTYPNKQSQFKGDDGGGHMAEYVVSQVTGLPIHYFVAIDFSGFKRTIDTLGGVDITVEKTFDDTEYPIEGKENDLCGHPVSDLPLLTQQATTSAVETIFPCRYEHLHFDKGLQHMNGETALKYVRSRHSVQDGTDFGRSKRQQNLLVAVKQKVMSINFLPQVVPFINSLSDDLKTDMNVQDVNTFITYAQSLNGYSIQNLAITDQNFLVDDFASDGEAILTSKAGTDNWTSVQQWIRSYTDSSVPLNYPVIQVQNGTKVAGLASLATTRLKDMNLNVLDPMDSTNNLEKKTVITLYRKNISKSVIDTLKNEFHATPIYGQHTTGSSSYDIQIIIGADYTPSAASVGK